MLFHYFKYNLEFNSRSCWNDPSTTGVHVNVMLPLWNILTWLHVYMSAFMFYISVLLEIFKSQLSCMWTLLWNVHLNNVTDQVQKQQQQKNQLVVHTRGHSKLHKFISHWIKPWISNSTHTHTHTVLYRGATHFWGEGALRSELNYGRHKIHVESHPLKEFCFQCVCSNTALHELTQLNK